MPAPLQTLSDNKKDTKNAKDQDDVFEDDDDDVFQQYMPQNTDNDSKPVQNLQLPGNSVRVKGTFYFVLVRASTLIHLCQFIFVGDQGQCPSESACLPGPEPVIQQRLPVLIPPYKQRRFIYFNL